MIPTANMSHTMGGMRPAGAGAATRARPVAGWRPGLIGKLSPEARHEEDGDEDRRAGDDQRSRPAPCRGQEPDRREATEHAGHPGELEDIEPHGAGRAALVEQDRREPGNHPEAVAEADEHAPQDEDGKRAGAPQQEHPRDQERGRGGERRPEPAPREQPRRHIRDHAGEAEAPGEEPELPVGEALRAGDLGKERSECADTDGVREHHQAQQRRAGAAHAAIRE